MGEKTFIVHYPLSSGDCRYLSKEALSPRSIKQKGSDLDRFFQTHLHFGWDANEALPHGAVKLTNHPRAFLLLHTLILPLASCWNEPLKSSWCAELTGILFSRWKPIGYAWKLCEMFPQLRSLGLLHRETDDMLRLTAPVDLSNG